jgi:hypothetical protein
MSGITRTKNGEAKHGIRRRMIGWRQRSKAAMQAKPNLAAAAGVAASAAVALSSLQQRQTKNPSVNQRSQHKKQRRRKSNALEDGETEPEEMDAI